MKKHAETSQGDWLRTMMGIACLGHCIFFVVGLALIGFITMIINLTLASLSYSAYLTLKEAIIIFYLFSLFASIGYGFKETLFSRTDATSYMQMGIVANIALYGSIIFFAGKSYYHFRLTGGVKGTAQSRKKDSAFDKAGKIAGKVGDKIE